MKNSAISIICCDRFDYFKRTFEAIIGGDIESRKIFIFQDFPRKKGKIDGYKKIEEYVESFKKENSDIDLIYVKSESNLGIASQWHRAMNYPLEYFSCDVVYMFEDDLVVKPNFISTMDQLWAEFKNDKRVGIFSCFNATYRNQGSGFERMGHDWGFGIGRDVWLEVRPYYEEYLNLLQNRAYSDRQSNVVKAWLESYGFLWKGGREGCDSVFEYILTGLGFARVCTYENLAVPIGEEGEHFNKASFDEIFSNLASADKVEVRRYTDADHARIFERHLVSSEFLSDGKLLASQKFGKDNVERFSGASTRHLHFETVSTFSSGSAYISKKNFDDHWSLSAGQGTLYGPYVKIEPGIYMATVKYSGAGVFDFKVTSDQGRATLNVLSVQNFSGIDVECIHMFFRADELIHDLEIVIDASTPSIFAVTKISLVRVGV